MDATTTTTSEEKVWENNQRVASLKFDSKSNFTIKSTMGKRKMFAPMQL